MSSDHLPRALEFCQQRAQRWMERHDALRDRVPVLIREAQAEAWDEGWLAGLYDSRDDSGTDPVPNPHRD